MPEGPEVKLTAEYLNKTLENKIIVQWEFLDGQYAQHPPRGFDEFEKYLPFLVEEVDCKGKLLFFVCFNEYKRFHILHSLRMTGRWQEYPDKYCRWVIQLDDGKKLWLRDPRSFSTLCFTSNEESFNEALGKIGPDILGSNFTLELWRNIVNSHKNKNITSFLMNQNIISGCGNYIKSEVLYNAQVSPKRKVGTLTEEESERIFEELRVISRTSYNNKGLSIRDYADEKGKKGFHEFSLRIYNKKHATRTKTPDGRTTYWDPKIQK